MSRARDLAAFVSNADGDVKFDTDTLFIDSSANRVGISTDTPASVLHVKGRTLAVDGAAASDSPRLNLDLDGTNKASVLLNRVTEDLQLTVVGDNIISFTANSSEKVRIDDDGLKFNGDTAAANALDDYEEGAWSPSLVGAGGGTKAGIGTYVKIGRTILLTCTINSIGTGLSGNLTITGLPFTINPSNQSTLDQYIPLQFFSLNWDDNAKAVYGLISDNSTTIVPYYSLDNAYSTNIQGSHCVTDTYLRFTQMLETA